MTSAKGTASSNASKEEDILNQVIEAMRPKISRFATLMSAKGADGEREAAAMGAMARYWESVRRRAGLSRQEVANLMNISRVDLAGFEAGIVPMQDLPMDFLPQLAVILDQPSAFNDFIQEHGHLAAGNALKNPEAMP